MPVPSHCPRLNCQADIGPQRDRHRPFGFSDTDPVEDVAAGNERRAAGVREAGPGAGASVGLRAVPRGCRAGSCNRLLYTAHDSTFHGELRTLDR